MRPRRQTEWGPGIIGQGQLGNIGEAPVGRFCGRLYVPTAEHRSGYRDHFVYDDKTPDRQGPGFRKR